MAIAWNIRRHALAWVGLAGFALAYLTGLYLFYAETLTSGASADAPATVQSGTVSASGIAQLRSEIAILRRQLDEMKRRDEEISERLATMETAFGPNTASLPPHGEEADILGSTRQNAVARSTPVRGSVTVTYAPLPADGFADLMIDRSPLPIANAGHTTRTMFGVELGADKTAQALHKKWAELGARHKGLLGGLQARHRDGNPDEDTMRLIAGPFPNAAEAAQLCASLRAAGTQCKETVFVGDKFQ